MAVIFEEALKKNISSGNLMPVYILFGEDAYLKTLYLEKISRSIAEPDDVFNFCKFTGQCDLQAVYDAVMQLPFMSDRKCVILNDFDFLGCSQKDFDRLISLLGEVPPEVTVIMYFDSVETDHKKGGKFKKLISAAEKTGGCATLLNHRSHSQLVKMLCDGAAKRKCRLDSSVASYLVDMAGEDINLLKNELEKLCAYVGEGVATKAHIDLVCTKTVEANIYKLTDYILACNSTEALKTLDELFFMRIEPMAVLYTISGVFVDMYRVYCGRQQSKTKADIVSTFGYAKNKEFLVDNAGKNLRRFDYKKLNLCLKTLTAADKSLKSFGNEPRNILEQLIVKLIYIIATGESLD